MLRFKIKKRFTYQITYLLLLFSSVILIPCCVKRSLSVSLYIMPQPVSLNTTLCVAIEVKLRGEAGMGGG